MRIRKTIGWIVRILGVLAALYVGVYVCFIGGILDIIEAIRILIREDVLATGILTLGILKFMFAGLLAYLVGFIITFISIVIEGIKLIRR